MTRIPKARALKRRRPTLPKTFRGARVIRGLGMDAGAFDALIDKRSMDQFDATGEMWIVVEDNALEGRFPDTNIRAFDNQKDALRCARAHANGNVDQRVLRVTAQVLVVATENDL